MTPFFYALHGAIMSKGKRGNKYGANLDSFGNTSVKAVALSRRAILEGYPVTDDVIKNHSYRTALQSVLSEVVKRRKDGSITTRAKFYAILSNIYMHAQATRVTIIINFPGHHISTSLSSCMTPVHMYFLYKLMIEMEIKWTLSVEVPYLELYSFRNDEDTKNSFIQLTEMEAEPLLKGKNILYINSLNELNVTKYDNLPKVGTLCFAWKLYTESYTLGNHPTYENPELLFRSTNGEWNIIQPKSFEIRFIDAVASFLFHMTREFDEVLRWTLDLRRITGDY